MSFHVLKDVLVNDYEYPPDFQPLLINEDLINCTFSYIKDYVGQKVFTVITELLRNKLEQVYLEYMLLTLHSDLFIEVTQDASSNQAREVKRDLNKALKCIEDIRIILHGRHAGKEINKFLMQERHRHRIASELGELKYACEEALRHYSPEKGRNTSKEREARINMIVSLITIFEGIQVPNTSGQEGDFDQFMKRIYEILKIDVLEPHEDIKRARKLFLVSEDKKNI